MENSLLDFLANFASDTEIMIFNEEKVGLYAGRAGDVPKSIFARSTVMKGKANNCETFVSIQIQFNNDDYVKSLKQGEQRILRLFLVASEKGVQLDPKELLENKEKRYALMHAFGVMEDNYNE